MLFGRHPPTQHTRPVEWALFDVKPDQHGLPKARATNNGEWHCSRSSKYRPWAPAQPRGDVYRPPPEGGDQLELELEFIM